MSYNCYQFDNDIIRPIIDLHVFDHHSIVNENYTPKRNFVDIAYETTALLHGDGPFDNTRIFFSEYGSFNIFLAIQLTHIAINNKKGSNDEMEFLAPKRVKEEVIAK